MRHTIASTHTGGCLYEIGAIMAGYRPIWGVEIRPDIADVAERNIPGLAVIRSDVAAVDWSALETPYHFHTSPSCKNASLANSEGGEAVEDIASAEAICAALRQLQPPIFSLENVWPYRQFDSFRLIVRTLRELGYCVDWWHLNFANYGVPQTRKRLIMIARRDRQPRKPQPTHSKRPDPWGLYKPWVGWYESILDILHTLPDSEFAPWQESLLPEELKTMLLAQGGYDGRVVNRLGSEPAFTITANGNQSGLRTFLIRGDNAGQEGKRQVRYSDDPAPTVTNSNGALPRAFVVGSQHTGAINNRNVQTRTEAEPYFTVTASEAAQPSRRAYVNGRVVQMTPRALARFQSVPDSYILPGEDPDASFEVLIGGRGLACEIIGNGVSCLMSKAICEAANG